MKKQLMTLFVVFVFSFLLLFTAGYLFAQNYRDVRVPLESAEVLRVDSSLERVAVGNPEIVRVSVINTREILLFGKKTGQTSLHVWTDAGRREFRIRVERVSQYEFSGRSRDLLRKVGDIDQKGMEMRVFSPQHREVSEFVQYIEDLLGGEGEVLFEDSATKKIFVIGKTENLDKIDNFLDKLDKPGEGTMYTQRIVLKHRSVSETVENIREMVSDDGTVLMDRETNSLLVVEEVSKVNDIANYIKAIDVQTTRQVRIEARFVEMSERAEKEIGIDWDYSGRISGQNARASLQNQVGGSSGMALDIFRGDGNLRARINMLEEEGLVNSISSPSVTTRSGTTAKLEIINEISYIAGRENFFDNEGNLTRSEADIQKVDDGIKLTVTPVLGQADIIQMAINASLEVATLRDHIHEGELYTIPEIDRRRVVLDVSLKDGQTLILGGLNREQESDENTSVPFFGRIPIIGGLFFSRDAEAKENTNISIFVTASIVELSEDGYVVPTDPDEVLSGDTEDEAAVGDDTR